MLEKKQKILLLKPCWPHLVGKHDLIYNRIWPPLSLANCASLLRDDGHAVTILDAHLERMVPSKVATIAKDFDKVFMTSSSLDRWECPNLELEPFIETAKQIRDYIGELYVMGYHGTVKPDEILKLTQARAVIRGEPEMIVKQICQRDRLSMIAGITFYDGKNIHSNADRKEFDLKMIPTPAFDLLKIDRYSHELLGGRFVLIETSRGCRFSCTFCYKSLYGRGVRKKTTQQVINELEEAIERCGAQSGYFMDLDFGMNLKLVKEVCNFLELKKYNFKWTCQIRVDDVNKGLLAKMANAGCQLVHYGVEASTTDKLDLFNKRISIAQVKEAVQCAHDLGIETACSFLFDYEAQNQREAKENINFAKQLNPTYASFHVIYPFLGTQIYHQSSSEVQRRFADFTCKNWFSTEQKKLIRSAYVQFYVRPHYFLSRFQWRKLKFFFKQLRLFVKFNQI